MKLEAWLRERWQNARRIASQKTGDDRAGWLEDADYFLSAANSISAYELLRDEHSKQEKSAALPDRIDMVLHCPKCGLQHIDETEQINRRLAASDPPAAWAMTSWDNPPHRSHLCHGCGHIWRPADVPTNGVAAVKTKGKQDSPITQLDQKERCPYCDGTGDVHSIDGQWRGTCTCEAGQQQAHANQLTEVEKFMDACGLCRNCAAQIEVAQEKQQTKD